MSISVSGSIKAYVTADLGDFSISGSSLIFVEQVKKVLSEKCSGIEKIKVMNRG